MIVFTDSSLLPCMPHKASRAYLGSNEILVTGPLGTSECAGECRFSANLCKRALYITADLIVEATHNADILTINASEDFQ